MAARRAQNQGSPMKPVCPKCGKDLVLSQPDGSPLLDGYVHMECMSCSDKVRYTVLKSQIPKAPVSFGNVKIPRSLMKLLGVIVVICIVLVIVNMGGNLSFFGSGAGGGSNGNIVGSWVAGDTVHLTPMALIP